MNNETQSGVAVSSSKIVRRLACDFEKEAKVMVELSGEKDDEAAYAIRWCKKQLLKAFAQPSNDQAHLPQPDETLKAPKL